MIAHNEWDPEPGWIKVESGFATVSPEAMAEAVLKDKSQEGYVVISMQEILEMRGYLNRAAGIKLLDQETKQAIHDIAA